MVKVTVIGCGHIGVKIAGELALHGHNVALQDSNKAKLDMARERIESDRAQLIEDGLPKFMLKKGSILYMDSLKLAVHNADFVFEAVVEDLEAKKNIFKDVSTYCPQTCVICSGTISLDLDAVMELAESRERTIGVRFLYPVLCVPEVEVTRNSYSSDEFVEKVMVFLSGMEKQVIARCKEPFLLSEREANQRRTCFIEKMKFKCSLVIGAGKDSIRPLLSSMSSSSSTHSSHLSLNLSPVSPLISAGGGSENSASSPSSRECAICMDAERQTLLCPCRHLITCSSCSWSLMVNQEACPICRAPIKEILHVFHS